MPEEICRGPHVSEISPLDVLLGIFSRHHRRRIKENDCEQPGNLTSRAILELCQCGQCFEDEQSLSSIILSFTL